MLAMRRIWLLTAITAMLGLPVTATADVLPSPYRIVAPANGECLAFTGELVGTRSCGDSATALYIAPGAFDDNIHIRHLTRCLTTGELTPSAFTCGEDGQDWLLEEIADDEYRITDAKDGRALTFVDNKTIGFAVATTDPLSGWRIEPVR